MDIGAVGQQKLLSTRGFLASRPAVYILIFVWPWLQPMRTGSRPRAFLPAKVMDTPSVTSPPATGTIMVTTNMELFGSTWSLQR